MIRIAIVDDHRLFRKSLSSLIKTFAGMDVLFDAENGREFFELLKGKEVDVVLLDIQMPEMDGFETCTRLRNEFPLIKVLMVSQLTTNEAIRKIMEMGAHGFFTKNSDPEQIEHAIRTIKDKDFYFEQDLGAVIKQAYLLEKQLKKNPRNKNELSAREIEIIRMACKEYSSSQIAEKLFINVRTVETHRKHIMDKTGSKNFIGVVLFTLRNGYLELENL